MKNYRLLTLLTALIFLTATGSALWRQNLQRSTLPADACRSVLPDATTCSAKQGDPPHFQGWRVNPSTGDKELVGIAFLSTDITPQIQGYAGPIRMLVGLTPAGEITRVHILEHHETPSYVQDGLPRLLAQFTGRKFNDPFVLGKDIDGISRATVTSAAITRSVETGARAAAAKILRLDSQSRQIKTTLALDQILVPLFLFLTAVLGVLRHSANLRRVALIGGLIYFGLIKSTMISVVPFANLALMKIPSFEQLPLWHMLVGLTLLSTLLLGMVYCGSLCPFAPVQEFLFYARRRLFPGLEAPQPSRRWDTRARYLKYGVLTSALALSAILGNSQTVGVEPFITLFSGHGSPWAWALLGLMLLAALFYFRFWCKYLCPAGAGLSLIARFSPFKIRLGKDCLHCHHCAAVCPTQAIHEDATETPVIDYPECILCGKCVQGCPQESLRVGRNG